MKNGQGYSAYYREYRLYVQASGDGWRVRVLHMPTQLWLPEDEVAGPTVGKDAAITVAVLAENPTATREIIVDAKASLKWEYYEP